MPSQVAHRGRPGKFIGTGDVAERIVLSNKSAELLTILSKEGIRREWESSKWIFVRFRIFAAGCQLLVILPVSLKIAFRSPIFPARWHSKWNSTSKPTQSLSKKHSGDSHTELIGRVAVKFRATRSRGPCRRQPYVVAGHEGDHHFAVGGWDGCPSRRSRNHFRRSACRCMSAVPSLRPGRTTHQFDEGLRGRFPRVHSFLHMTGLRREKGGHTASGRAYS